MENLFDLCADDQVPLGMPAVEANRLFAAEDSASECQNGQRIRNREKRRPTL